MAIKIENIRAALKKARENAKKRNFRQSVELIINLRNIDLKKPEFRISQQVTFPNPLPIEVKLCVIATGDLALRAKDAGVQRVISREELTAFGDNRAAVKKLANDYTDFIAQTELMPLVGKNLGPVLAPRGKMPRPVPSTIDVSDHLKKLQAITLVQLKKEPIMKLRIGTEDMTDEQLAENAMPVFNLIETRLQRGLSHVTSVFVKHTMGQAVAVDV